jgi:nucleotide-binding universal stress UspA family protein
MVTSGLRHILFPYDFSSQGRQIVRFVKGFAGIFDARVTLFSVVPPVSAPVPSEMGGPEIRTGEHSTDWKQALQTRLDEALVDDLAGFQVERVADSGDPAWRIAAFARDHAVDLVMMPTHGHGLFRSLIGSVTSKVLHDATCPVWTAAHAETQVTPDLPRNILCAVDTTPEAAALVRYAAEFSAKLGATLKVVHVVEPVSDLLELAGERRLQEEVRQSASTAVASVLESTGIDATFDAIVGAVADTVTAAARQERADLVIIGRGVLTEPFGPLRTHALAIIHGSPCPVLSV